MKKRSLAVLGAAVFALSVLFTGCGNGNGGSGDAAGGDAGDGGSAPANVSASVEVKKAYYSYTDMQERASGEYTVPMATDETLYIFSNDTYMLTNKSTMDISGPSAGYLNEVGCMKVKLGKCTYSDEDGETMYVLEDPDRVIFSSYMMKGPTDVTEIYVDSADAETYANYSVDDITGKSADEVVDILCKAAYDGSELTEEAPVNYVVNEDTFMLEEKY